MSKKEESTTNAARLLEDDEDEDEDDDYDDDDDDDDEEDEIKEEYSDVDDEDEDELDTNEEENQEKNESFALLKGSLQMNDEGRVVYYGKWCMNTEFENGEMGLSAKKKRFRLKSKQCFTKEQLDLTRPADSCNPSRAIKFDGFIVDAKGMKIRERNVTLIFSVSTQLLPSDASLTNNTAFVVRGSGLNEFGPFFLDGQYSPPTSKTDEEEKYESKEILSFPLELKKSYDDSQASNKPSSSSSRKRDHYQLHDNAKTHNGKDHDDEVDGENVEYELAGLYEEACMSVDELKSRYQIRKKNGDNEKDYHVGEDTKKRYKQTGLDDDDDDDGCGF